MRYRRALLLAELAVDPRASIAALRRVAPELEQVLVVVRLPVPTFAWLTGEVPSTPDPATLASVELLREAAAAAASHVDVQLTPELRAPALLELAIAAGVDLLVAGARSLRSAAALGELRKRLALPVLWPEGAPGEPRTEPIHEVTCVALTQRDRASLAAFLRDHGDPSLHVTMLSPSPPEGDLAVVLDVAGIEADVEVPEPSLRRWLEGSSAERAIDLLVLVHAPLALLAGAGWPAPVLLLPSPSAAPMFTPRALDLADLVDDGGTLRGRLESVAPVGDIAPLAEQVVAFVAAGRVIATVLTTRAGEAELPAGIEAHSLGAFRLVEEPPADPLAAVEERVAIVRPTDRPVVLVDPAVSDDALRAAIDRAAASGAELLAVRLRPTRSCRAIRERLRMFGAPARVLDARAVLDEGEALDVSEAIDPVRLARVAAALRRAGFAITEPAPAPPSEPLAGNRIEVELDNALARRWLLDAIAGATEAVHLQVYMAADDDAGRAVETALAAAGARGVAVRVLVDSLHGLHGSFGTQNPLLARLGARPGVELRISRPITELPSLEDIKQRDHRKLVVVDGRVALIGGRNLSHEYYVGFDEIPLTARALWREVPWLDAGARVEGPAVAALHASFLAAWTGAGGAPFAIATPGRCGTTAARVVVHQGMRDARTLDAYREMIDGARSHLYAINGFPLMLELQHALVRAVRRGVRVRSLVGHLTPSHGEQLFEGPWASARTAATELVHSRIDALVEAGAEAYHYAVRDRPGWDPGLGPVHPHVHAKLMSVDGERFAVGSANLDITSAYWESELMIVVDDAALTRALESHLDTLLAGSVRVQRDDPKWQQLAHRRAWMRHWPGVLAV